MARRSAGAARLVWAVTAILLLACACAPGAVIVADTIAARRAFPLLASFETVRELARWDVSGCRIAREPNYATSGRYAGKLVVDESPGNYSGMFLAEPPPEPGGLPLAAPPPPPPPMPPFPALSALQ